MGCRTGFYLLLAGDYESKEIVPLMIELYEFIRDYKGVQFDVINCKACYFLHDSSSWLFVLLLSCITFAQTFNILS